MVRPGTGRIAYRLFAAALVAAAGSMTLLASLSPARAEISSYAIVRDDATLTVRSKTIRLYGIYIPATGRHCRFNLRPPACGSRAAVALKQRIQGFVTCYETARYRDGSLQAVCYAERTPFDDGVDLGAWLIGQGLAVATPEAPFAYHTAERIARSRDQGLWGFSADSIR
jgi:endonuclease YncB( thermonuclease family)